MMGVDAGLRLGRAFQDRSLAGPGGVKALLGGSPRGVIVSDRYAGYRFIDLQQRQGAGRTCCATSRAWRP